MRLTAQHRATVARALAKVPGLTEEPMVTICAWCYPRFVPDGMRATHGICEAHAAEMLEQARSETQTARTA